MKKVSKYIVISLVLLLSLCCVGVLYLFFVPNSTLFNITYINMHKELETKEYETELINKIELNSRSYDILVTSSESDKVSLKAYSNSFGFVLNKNKSFSITEKLDNGILTFSITEPHGFAAKNSSYIELYIPSDLTCNLTISNTQSKTTIDSADLTIKDLKYSTKKGDLELSKGSILGDLTLNLQKADAKITKEFTTNENNVSLSLTSGSFKAPKSILGDIEVTYNERGVIEVDICGDIRVNQKSAGGRIYINNAYDADIIAGDTLVVLKTVTANAAIELTKSGSVTIDSINGSASIITNSGNINIGSAYSTLYLNSESGNINVASATLLVSITANYGDVNINFSDYAESYLHNTNSRVLYATIKNGKLTATGIEHIGETQTTSTSSTGGIKINGNGRAFISMLNAYGKNSILGNNGSVRVVINKDSQYTLKTLSQNGNVRVNLTQISEYNGYTTKTLRTTNVNCSSSTNLLNISTNYGDLTVLDTNFA